MHCLPDRKHLQDANKVAQGSACDIWWWIWQTRMFSFRYMVLAAFCPTAKRPRGSALFICVPSVWYLPTDAYANISIQCAHASCLELNQRLGKGWWAYKVGICRSLYKGMYNSSGQLRQTFMTLHKITLWLFFGYWTHKFMVGNLLNLKW